MTDAGKGVYLYCCALSDALPEAPEVESVEEGSPPSLRRAEDLAAVWSEVSLESFAGPGSEERLKDLGWLAPRALRHQAVVEAVGRSSPVFPARFGTIFSSLESLDRLLETHRRELRQFLDRVAGMEEWGVKGYLDRAKARERLVDEELAAPGAALSTSPGVRYMQERRLRAEADARLRRWLAETSRRALDELSHRAAQTAERRPVSSGAAGPQPEMVSNWAFLVPRAGVDDLREAGARLGRELGDWGLAFELSGPFPPYSFTPPLLEPRR